MSVVIKFFGQLEEVTHCNKAVWPVMKDTDMLRKRIISVFPVLKKHPFVIAVNKKIVKENQLLKPDDEVALLPPFAGG